MKKISIFLFLYGLAVSSLWSQSANHWPKAGAKWTMYAQDYISYQQLQSLELSYVYDTLIHNKVYAVVHPTLISNQPIANIDPITYDFVFGHMRLLFRQSGDTIYRFVNERDYIYFINGLEVGQQYETFRPFLNQWQKWSCTDLMKLEVMSVQILQLNNKPYRSVFLQDTITDGAQNFQYQYIEEIGLAFGLPFITMDHIYVGEPQDSSGNIFNCLVGVFESKGNSLAGYTDDSTSITFFTIPSDVGLAPGLNDASVLLFPNPAEAYFSLSIDDPLQTPWLMQLTDLSGRLLQQERLQMSPQDFSIAHLSKGIYLVSITDPLSKRSIHKKLVKY